jgi:hypothetical protein
MSLIWLVYGSYGNPLEKVSKARNLELANVDRRPLGRQDEDSDGQDLGATVVV